MQIVTSWMEEGIEQGLEQGRQEGRQEGRREGEANLILRLLDRRFGELNPELETQIRTLSCPQLEALAEALLDFTQPADLEAWLQNNSQV